VERQLAAAYEVARELQELSIRLVKVTEEAAQALGIPINQEGERHA
jgi:hypothetical protein